MCERVDSIRVTECMDYSTYEDPGFTGVFFGYGRPLDYDAPLLRPGGEEARGGNHAMWIAGHLAVVEGRLN